MGKPLNLVGEQYGWLTVDEKAGSIGNSVFWYCTCQCGTETMVRTGELRNGKTTSCGCKKHWKGIDNPNFKHGGTMGDKASAEYHAWEKLKERGQRPSEWDDFKKFFKDVGWRPGDTYILARHDNRQPHGINNTYWREPNEEREQRRSRSVADEFCIDMSSVGDTYSCTTAPDQARERQAAGVH